MQGRQRLLEISETQIGERRIMGLIKSVFFEKDEYMQFYLKNQDKVYFDPR